MHEGGKKAVVAALLANLAIAVAKFVGFIFTGAASMLAESVHSLADTGNQALLLLGGRLARRGPSASHPFGYGRERFFWAFVVAMVLFSVGALVALYEGFEKLAHPHKVEDPLWAIGILCVAIVLESLSFRTAIRESRKVKKRESWRSFIRRTKVPELSVVLLEDLGALLGLTFALVGVTVATITDNGRFDALGSIAIGFLLLVIAITLASETKSMLIGEAADPDDVAKVEDAIVSSPQVSRLIHLRTLHLSPEEILVAAKVEFHGELDSAQISAAINETERNIRQAVPNAKMIFIEPDQFLEDVAPASAARPFSD